MAYEQLPLLTSALALYRSWSTAVSAYFVSFQPAGLALGCYEAARSYVLAREQFGAPLAANQLVQAKLVHVLFLAQACAAAALRLASLHAEGKLTHGQASLVKAETTRMAREAAGIARDLQGGNGMLTDYLCAKHLADAEAYYTYEGAHDINMLVAARDVLGISALRPNGTHAKSKL